MKQQTCIRCGGIQTLGISQSGTDDDWIAVKYYCHGCAHLISITCFDTK